MRQPPKRRHLEITISWTTLLKIFLAGLLAYLGFRLWRLAELLLLALMVAIAFQPLIQWTKRHRWPKWSGVLLVAVLLLGAAALFVIILVPKISTDGTEFIKQLPDLRERLSSSLPQSGPVRDFVSRLSNSHELSNPEAVLKYLAGGGSAALEGLLGFFLVLIVAIYFLADGEQVSQWLLSFLPDVQRQKMAVASEAVGAVVGQYMVGQVITSVLCAGYAFAVLTIMQVPNALLLALLAGILDVLPLIGFFLFTIPAVALALTVSPMTAALVGGLYVAYHVVENYLIVPKVYGNCLRLSTLTVLVSCLAAGLIDGVVGIILVLPIVASYPIIERVWLEPFLKHGTAQKHARLDAEEHPQK